jgi:predicted metalloprotease with PDZ domain
VAALASSTNAADIQRQVQVAGSTIDVSVTGELPVSEAALFRWVETSARGVAEYLGRYPVPRVRLFVRAGGRGAVGHGVTFGGRSPSIRIAVGRDATEETLRTDWVLTHEMTHLGFPDLTSEDEWAEEGMATYVEPLARVRAGTLSADKMWADLLDGIPKGLPRPGDRGLHRTQEWGRTYWGGALFWLLSDVEIRERSHGRQGLPDALRAIRDAGGDIRSRWPLSQALNVADRALGQTTLANMYARLGTAPGNVDLADLWRRLGVRRERGRVVYDDDAPLAAVRRAMAGSSAR